MTSAWKCPKCSRIFSRKNQRHRCGTGSRDDVLRDRPDTVVQLYDAIEKYVSGLGSIEIVARDRYVLFRTTRIFADLSIMKDAIRVAIHIARTVENPIFFKTVSGRGQVTHVTKVKGIDEVKDIESLLKEAYEFSISRTTDS